MVGRLPASHKECRPFCKLFLILSLLVLFMNKFGYPSSIIDYMAKNRRCFVLATSFCFSALTKLSHSLIVSTVAFTTEVWQFWDLLSALLIQPGMFLLQKENLPIQLKGAYFSYRIFLPLKYLVHITPQADSHN